MASGQVVFSDPHPHGLPAGRYSHFIRPLGKGAFGEVYLCCLRTEVPQQQQQQAPAPAPLHSDQGSSGDLASGAPPPAGADGPTGREPPPGFLSPQPPVYDYQWVAVKLSKPLPEYSRQSLEYLKREAVCQRRLNHMHVVGFREVGCTSAGRLYIALEFADSGNLRQWLEGRGGRLPEGEARWFFQQLVYGLDYCHAHGVYNRDIKPENLLLHRCGLELPLLKVADFGLCKSSNDSMPNSCVGSPNYMAPEVFMQTGRAGSQAGGVPAYDGKKADVFSCGVVLYRLVFGCLPFNRTPDGRPLHTTRDLHAIVDNMRHERWPLLLSHSVLGAAAPAAAQPPPTGAEAASGAAAACGASASLLELLGGMLRCNPDARMSLADVKRHPWYRVGLSDEIYAMILAGDAATDGQDAAGGPGGGGAQSIEVIEQQFDRVLVAYDSHRREAARQAAEEAEAGDDEGCDDGAFGD